MINQERESSATPRSWLWWSASISRRRSTARAASPSQRLARAARRGLKPRDDRQRGVEVEPVEDRLVNLVEAHVVEAGGLEDPRGHVGVPERERVRARRRSAAPRRRARRRSAAPTRCCSRRCQTSSTRRASGRSAAAMFANAAAGSAKNIVPNRLIATSKRGRVEAMHLRVATLVARRCRAVRPPSADGRAQACARTRRRRQRGPAPRRAPPRESSARFRSRCRATSSPGLIP